MRKIAAGLSLFLLLLAALAYLFRGDLALMAYKAGLRQAVKQATADNLPDGLHLLLCGSGSPLPDPNRAGPCVAILAGSALYVVDAGSGGSRNLIRFGFPIGRVRAILLTHFHSDHIDGLGEMAMQRWVGGGHRSPVPIIAPAGVEPIVEGFNRAYATDSGYRNAHHGDAIAPLSGSGMTAAPFTVPRDGSAVTVIDQDGLKVSAFTVEHDPVEPAVGYRFEYKGRSIVLSGDTRKSDQVVRHAANADLLAHEALSPELVSTIATLAKDGGNAILGKIANDILDYHTSPIDAAQVARAAKAKALLYYHIVPPLAVPGLDALFLKGTEAAFGQAPILGRDGTLVSLPAGGSEIITRKLN